MYNHLKYVIIKKEKIVLGDDYKFRYYNVSLQMQPKNKNFICYMLWEKK